ncbi:MAG: ABC transporter ATP-binding protein/permease [Anaerovibrio sp.]|nr:ABC transporter ATP-binding protein/permease [Selenomonadaceae bacterium]MDD6397926.1 ABC transporter ATP-binding protein/permease [Selenomonadaceae bacterium]MDY6053270.1 ABC transporter ATP-binding protein/permease [Anaerovibrio sp.]
MKKRDMAGVVWKLVRSYWRSEERWWARGMLAVVVALSLLQVYMLVLLNQWNNEFYNALQGYNYGSFWPLIGEFTTIAFIYIIVAVYAIYLRQMLEIRWRTWMTKNYLSKWLHKQTYYRLQVTGSADMDNPDQRISDDIGSFISLSLQLSLGVLKQLTTLVAFVFILWQLSGVLDIPLGDTVVSVPGYMVFVTLFYSIAGTWIAHKVGKKLIGLNYDQQRYEADFRFSMVRVRENSESIAFYGGEEPEHVTFNERFQRVVTNFWGLMKRTKLLNFYVTGYGQLAIIVPILMVAPKYFEGNLQLGGLMQTISAFGRVQDALSYFVDAYSSIAQYMAVIRRLSGFTAHMEEAEELQDDFQREKTGTSLVLKHIKVDLPNGQPLLQDLSLEISTGDKLLIAGASGCGKSTLLRALAGIWPYGSGEITTPEKWRVMFLPQRPYLPLGSLRQAIYYPQPVPEQETEDIKALLNLFGVSHLADSLDKVDDWSRILSLGEQQRLAFIRILLFKPEIVFLDESTSAMDEDREAEAYDVLSSQLPDTAVVSVGHRSTLRAKHQRELKLAGSGQWEIHDIV